MKKKRLSNKKVIVVLVFAVALLSFVSAAHPDYPAFANPEFSVNGNSLSASDDIIYNKGYYSINGASWTEFTLQGTPYGNGYPWLLSSGVGNLNLPSTGTHYVIVFSCSLVNNDWDCHENKWQLEIINNANPNPNPNPNGGDNFRFVSWADSRGGFSELSEMSDQIFTLSGPAPSLTIFPGDLESGGFTLSVIDGTWKPAMNGQSSGGSSNGLFDKTFATRGNHDESNTAGWQSYFNFQQIANNVGATNYIEMSGQSDLTYSFDYGNSHFVGIDAIGSVSTISSSQLSWLDSDLAAAQNRGLTHAFIFFHGPIYCVDGHCSCTSRLGCGPPSGLVTILNKYPFISATFHGHEHVFGYVHMDSSRITSITNEFEEFVTGNAGAPPYPCDKSERSDYCYSGNGFTVLDVSGSTVTANSYRLGSNTPIHSVTYTN